MSRSCCDTIKPISGPRYTSTEVISLNRSGPRPDPLHIDCPQGRRVAEVMSCSKINYSTMMGLFGNENRASRCFLVTVATELFLLSGSIEGALNTLRGKTNKQNDNKTLQVQSV